MNNHEKNCMQFLFQAPKPSCHDAITGIWKPSKHDVDCGRKPGFGATINIINGGQRFLISRLNMDYSDLGFLYMIQSYLYSNLIHITKLYYIGNVFDFDKN